MKYTRFSVQILCIRLTAATLLLSVGILICALRVKPQKDTDSLQKPSEAVYVFLQSGSSGPETDPAEIGGFWVRAYAGRIGIFSEEGELRFVIDTYIKSLPKADRDLLGEGVYVANRSDLSDLIEAYSD